MFSPARPRSFVCLSVCLSVCKISQKRAHGFGWNVACRQMSGYGRTDQLLSPIRITDRMPEPDCFLPQRMHCNAEFYYIGKIPRTGIGRPSKQRRVVLRRRNTVVGGKCALPSALLVVTELARRCMNEVNTAHVKCYNMTTASAVSYGYSATLPQIAYPSVRLYVCPSHTGDASKPMTAGSHVFHRRVSTPTFIPKVPGDHSSRIRNFRF